MLAAPPAQPAGRDYVGPGRLAGPVGVLAVDDGVVVAEFGTGSLVRVSLRGQVQSLVRGMRGPWSVAPAPGGGFWVSEPERGRIYQVSSQGRLSVFLSGLDQPVGLVSGAGGRVLYVAERRGRVLEIDGDTGRVRRVLTDRLAGADSLALWGGKLFVSIPTQDRVLAIDLGRGRLSEIADNLELPTGLAASGGQLFVAEGESGRIWEIRLSNRRRRLVGQAEPGLAGLALLPDGSLVAPALTSGAVWRLLPGRGLSALSPGGAVPTGSLRVEPVSRLYAMGMTPAEFGRHGRVVHAPLLRSLYDPADPLWGAVDTALGQDGTQVYTFTSRGRVIVGWGSSVRVLGQGLNRPAGVLIDPQGNVIVAESGAGRVVVLVPGGGQVPIAAGLGEPIDLAWHPQRGLLILDRETGRLLLFSPTGLKVLNGDLLLPEALAVLPDGDLAVVEAGADRVVRLDPDGRVKDVLLQTGPGQLLPREGASWQVLGGLAPDPWARVLYVGVPGRQVILELPLGGRE
jgi:sugar lactone lactonase YvrE